MNIQAKLFLENFVVFCGIVKVNLESNSKERKNIC